MLNIRYKNNNVKKPNCDQAISRDVLRIINIEYYSWESSTKIVDYMRNTFHDIR